mgnify:FL=1
MATSTTILKSRQTNFRNKMDLLKKSKKDLLKSFRNKLEEKKALEIKKKLLE